jgi:hypothetical protein
MPSPSIPRALPSILVFFKMDMNNLAGRVVSIHSCQSGCRLGALPCSERTLDSSFDRRRCKNIETF